MEHIRMIRYTQVPECCVHICMTNTPAYVDVYNILIYQLNTEYSKMNAQYTFQSSRAQNNDKIHISIHLHIVFKFFNWHSTLLVSGFITPFLHTKNLLGKDHLGNLGRDGKLILKKMTISARPTLLLIMNNNEPFKFLQKAGNFSELLQQITSLSRWLSAAFLMLQITELCTALNLNSLWRIKMYRGAHDVQLTFLLLLHLYGSIVYKSWQSNLPQVNYFSSFQYITIIP
jgi:hypothetical protein